MISTVDLTIYCVIVHVSLILMPGEVAGGAFIWSNGCSDKLDRQGPHSTGDNNSPDWCLRQCNNNNNTDNNSIVALQGNRCICLQRVPKQTDWTGCNQPCKGDNLAMCGGPPTGPPLFNIYQTMSNEDLDSMGISRQDVGCGVIITTGSQTTYSMTNCSEGRHKGLCQELIKPCFSETIQETLSWTDHRACWQGNQVTSVVNRTKLTECQISPPRYLKGTFWMDFFHRPEEQTTLATTTTTLETTEGDSSKETTTSSTTTRDSRAENSTTQDTTVYSELKETVTNDKAVNTTTQQTTITTTTTTTTTQGMSTKHISVIPETTIQHKPTTATTMARSLSVQTLETRTSNPSLNVTSSPDGERTPSPPSVTKQQTTTYVSGGDESQQSSGGRTLETEVKELKTEVTVLIAVGSCIVLVLIIVTISLVRIKRSLTSAPGQTTCWTEGTGEPWKSRNWRSLAHTNNLYQDMPDSGAQASDMTEPMQQMAAMQMTPRLSGCRRIQPGLGLAEPELLY